MDEETRERLRDQVHRVEASGSESAEDGMTLLREVLAGRQVVGLGTAATGAREPDQFRRRLVQNLVTGTEGTVVALPVGFAEAMALDRYVLGENTDLASTLAALSNPDWDTESMVALFEWLREYNADRPDHERARVYGLEAGPPASTVPLVRSYLDQVDPPFLETVRHNLSTVVDLSEQDSETSGRGQTDSLTALIDETERLLPTVRDRLEDHREEYVTAAGLDAWKRARQFVTLLEQRVSVSLARKQLSDGQIDDDTALERVQHLRGLTMADNLDWVRGYEDPAQILLLGNDSDLARVEQTDETGAVSVECLGTLLDTRYGSEYYALGTVVGGGTAGPPSVDSSQDWTDAFEQLTRDPLSEFFETAESSVALLDLSDEEAADLLDGVGGEDSGHRSLRTGPALVSTVSSGHAGGRRYVTDGRYADAFDGVWYFESVTPTVEANPED